MGSSGAGAAVQFLGPLRPDTRVFPATGEPPAAVPPPDRDPPTTSLAGLTPGGIGGIMEPPSLRIIDLHRAPEEQASNSAGASDHEQHSDGTSAHARPVAAPASARPESFRNNRISPDKLEGPRASVAMMPLNRLPGLHFQQHPLSWDSLPGGHANSFGGGGGGDGGGGAGPQTSRPASSASLESARASEKSSRRRRLARRLHWCWGWWKNVNIRTKQLFAAALLMLLMAGTLIGIHIGLLVTNNRRELEIDADSEANVMRLIFDKELEPAAASMGGQATREAVLSAVSAGLSESPAAASARAAAAAFLREECARLHLAYGTLVLREGLRIAAGCNSDRTGEAGFDPGSVASRAMDSGKVVSASATVSSEDALREGGGGLASGAAQQSRVLLQLVAVPVFLPGGGAVAAAALVAAKAALGAEESITEFISYLKEGYTGLYVAGLDGSFTLSGSSLRVGEGPPLVGVSIGEAPAGMDLLRAAQQDAHHRRARFDLRGTVMTWSTEPIVGPGGAKVGLFVRGKPESQANVLLRDALVTTLLAAGGTLVVALLLAALLARHIAAPIRELQKSIEGFLRSGAVEDLGKLRNQGRDEVGKLARAFGRMAERVKHPHPSILLLYSPSSKSLIPPSCSVHPYLEFAQQEVATEAYRTRRIMDAAADGIFLINAQVR
eukprot:tig00020849_g14660.t1